MAVNCAQKIQHKVVQRIGFVNERSNINGVSWSDDNRLVVGTNGDVIVVSLKGVENKMGTRLKIARSMITAKPEVDDNDLDKEFFSDKMIPMFADAPFNSTANLDPALNHTVLHYTGLIDMMFAKWSPVGCDKIGRSVLAVLFRTNKLALYTMEKSSRDCLEVVNITKLHGAQLKKEKYFEKNFGMRGKTQQPDPRQAIGDETSWTYFEDWQLKKYLFTFTSIAWYPVVVTCVNVEKTVRSKFVFLATAVKSGNLFIWQALLPLAENYGTGMQRVLAAHTSLFYPCSLAWSTVGPGGTSYLACGNTAGLIKVFFIKTTSTAAGLPHIAFVKAYTFIDAPDDRSVDCLVWHRKGNHVYLACSKGPEVSVFHAQLMQGGTLSKPRQEIVSGEHLLNVTGLAISQCGVLYSTSAEGCVQQYTVGSKEKATIIEYGSSSEFGCDGVTVSPNGVFLALFESRRKLYLGKLNKSRYPCSQVTLLSLVTDQHNHQQLMAWTSKPTELSQLWDRFYFQQMFAQKLSDTLVFPESLDDFPQNILQFLRNLLVLKTNRGRSWTNIGGLGEGKAIGRPTPKEEEKDVEMADKSGHFEVKSGSVEDIERRIGVMIMQNILTAFLECQQKIGNSSVERIGVLTQEPLLFAICRWLVTTITPLSPGLIKLLEKCRSTLLPFYESSKLTDNATVVQNMEVTNNQGDDNIDLPTMLPSNPKTTQDHAKQSSISQICENILDDVDTVLESCMCGELILFQELRSARCIAGHVFPRCCVTFKILDGTNCRVCTNCGAHALIQDPTSTSKLDWTKSLLESAFTCSFCGGWFEFVR